ncbi:MARVEL domain-containing protein 2-like [Megalops cyprinoides]|uniref:MARVEL domain-containing protein 2-like n=1 Tax=Megalops cyprinoides TaxID=118141 RepID=UPI001864A569|nr:MARVEL domain-containing protein 2-like [Megalops cyprinoides]
MTSTIRNSFESGRNRTPLTHEVSDSNESLQNQREDLQGKHSKRALQMIPDHDDSSAFSDSAAQSGVSPEDEEEETPQESKMKKRLLPQSWRGLFRKWRKGDDITASQQGSVDERILPNGTRVSPPVSPLLDRRFGEPEDSLRSSRSSRKPLLTDSPTGCSYRDALFHDSIGGSELTSIHPAEYYAEKLEVYQQKYSYLKSWPGLLRLLAGLQLLFGGMVFACVCAYIQKDSEWYNLYGFNAPSYSYSGYYYRGPMTAFVLAVAGLAWIVTVILLVLGLTMYYRTILLDSHWWPLTEAALNVSLFLLYLAAGIVYINDLNRGGMCYMTVGFNPLVSTLCRVEGGQMAGTAFIFINMLLYLISFLVCLKMWRHEVARRWRGNPETEPPPLQPPHSTSTTHSRSRRITFEDEEDGNVMKSRQIPVPESGDGVATLNRAIPTGYVPKPRVIPDYIMKYPDIHTPEEREKYKAVFNDQYQEYKQLHRDISATLRKFSELDAAMSRLLNKVNSREEQERINQMLKTYNTKKNEPAFLEKKERCDYLKAKLNHIKSRIQEFDRTAMAKSGP